MTLTVGRRRVPGDSVRRANGPDGQSGSPGKAWAIQRPAGATQESVGEFANLEARRLGIQIAFALMFAVIALIVLLSSSLATVRAAFRPGCANPSIGLSVQTRMLRLIPSSSALLPVEVQCPNLRLDQDDIPVRVGDLQPQCEF
jgi:hypothetical protein